MKKKLDAYRGRLSAAEIVEGMNAASKNARRLSEDAACLFTAGRFPTAASLAILAIEEAGKVSILRALALAASDVEAAEVWKEYRAHTRKNLAWLLPQLAASGARNLDDLRPLFDETSDHPFVLDQLKQLGFYTDCLGKAHWAVPPDVIDEALAQMLVQTAKVFACDREYTEKEIELWVEHVGPVWKKDPSWMKQALVNWYAAMQACGLAAEGTNEMERFVRDGLYGSKPGPS
jgi:AbiV family abortive infection protein